MTVNKDVKENCYINPHPLGYFCLPLSKKSGYGPVYLAHYAHCAPGSLLCSKQCQHFVERPTSSYH